MAVTNPYLQGITETPAPSEDFKKIISIESGGKQFDAQGNPLTSSAGAVGVSQILPSTAPEAAKLANVPYSEHRLKTDESYNRLLGEAYFKQQLKTFNDASKAAAAYNAGPGAVNKAITKYGGRWLEHLPEETQNYVKSFTGGKVTPAVSKGNPYLEGADTNIPSKPGSTSTNPYLAGSTQEPEQPVKEESLLEQSQQTIKNLVEAGKTGAGEALGLANVIAGTPEFVTKVAATPYFGVVSAIDNALEGRAKIDWEEASKRAQGVGEFAFGPLTKAVPKLAETAGLEKEMQTSTVNKALEAVGTGIEKAATKVEETTGIPKAGTAAVLETAMVTGVPGAKAVYTKIKRNVNDLANARRMDPTAEEWTNKTTPWVVPEATTTGVPITEGKIIEPSGTQALDSSGRPAIARHYKNEDGTSKEILIDLDEAAKRWEEKPWVKQGMPEETFKTPIDYAQFILKHEEEHTKLSFDEWKKLQDPNGDLFTESEGLRSQEQLRKDYEHYINRQAMDAIKEDPYVNPPDVMVPKVPKNVHEHWQWMADALDALRLGPDHDMTIAVNRRLAMEQDGVTPHMQQRWNDYSEGHGVLDPHEKELYDKYYAPEAAERLRLIKFIQDKGWSLPTELDPKLAGENVARKVVPKKPSQIKKLISAISEGKYGGFDQNVQAPPGAAMERTLFAGEMPSGRRVVLQQRTDANGNNYVVQWKNNVATKFADLPAGESLKAGSKIGSTLVKEARAAELDKHSPYQYEKDHTGVLYQRLVELRDFVRANQFLEDVKKSDWFKENAVEVKPRETLPEDYKVPKHMENVPELQGYAFPTDIAEIIEDFARSNDPNALTYISGALIKNMMLNPLPHMMNEGWHLYNARGLTGWVTPPGIYRFARSGMPALKSVITQDKFYRDIIKEGGSIMSAGVRNKAIMDGLFEKALKEFSETPEAESLAKRMGKTIPELYDSLSKKSSIAMWTVRDMMYVQLIKEKMMYENMSMKDAIKDVERHMPAYKIPHKVMGSRGLSVMLQNPNVSVFSRYHYGLVNSIKETAKDLTALKEGQAGLKHFLKGADTAAAIAVAIGVLYPLQDMLAAWLSGNEDAKQRRAGPYHIFHAIEDVAHDKKDVMSVLASIFTFNPALLALAQLGMNRKIYNGQPIYNPSNITEFSDVDGWSKVGYDIAKYVLTQMPMVGQAEKAQREEDEGFKNWEMRQLDIESPSFETATKQQKEENKRKKAGAKGTMRYLME